MTTHFLAPQVWEAEFRCAGINCNRRSRCSVVFTKAWSTIQPLRLLDFYCRRHQPQATTPSYCNRPYKRILPPIRSSPDLSSEQPRGRAAPLSRILSDVPAGEGFDGEGHRRYWMDQELQWGKSCPSRSSRHAHRAQRLRSRRGASAQYVSIKRSPSCTRASEIPSTHAAETSHYTPAPAEFSKYTPRSATASPAQTQSVPVSPTSTYSEPIATFHDDCHPGLVMLHSFPM